MKFSGIIYVIACNNCGHPAHYEGIASSNTFGMSSWTDGFNFYPMSDNSSSLFKCYSCSNIDWLSDAKKVGFMSANDFVDDENEVPDEIWRKSALVAEPTDTELCDALNNGLFKGTAKEKKARIIAWWKSNDKYRYILNSEKGDDGLFCKNRLVNMNKLKDLLELRNISELIMAAEISRESMNFEDTEHFLRGLNSDEEGVQLAISRILTLNEEKDFTVRKL